MKYYSLFKQFIALVVIALLLSACNKISIQNSTEDKGQTLVKILGGSTPATVKKIPIDLVNKSVTILVADIRRDIVNPTELNKTMVVTVKDDTAIVAATNPAYKILPVALYSVGSETPKSGNYYTVTLKPGEFAKDISITIPNPALLNPVSKYALGFTIETADAGGRISAQNSIVVEIVTVNNWDGVYLNIGNPTAPDHGFKDITNPAFVWLADQQYSLVTISPTKCLVVNDNIGIPGYLFKNNLDPAFYGSYGLVIGFDSTTNAINDLHNFYGDPNVFWWWNGAMDWANCATGNPLYAACNTRRAILDPSGVNAAQPNRDIIIRHFMLQPSVVPPPSIRCYFDETWKYIRPR